MTNKNELLKIWRSAVAGNSPDCLYSRVKISRGEAALFWGKAAARGLEASCALGFELGPVLVLSPDSGPAAGWKSAGSRSAGLRWIQGEHPIPGEGSLRAGAAVLDFFDALHRLEVRKLRVFLSGGASSLAWIPPRGVSLEDLQARLRAFYEQGLDIRELNRRRSALCALKGGGAAQWLRKLAPRVSVRVELISDVHPFGPEVVGSGPFCGDRIPHGIMSSNPRLVVAAAHGCRAAGFDVRLARSVAWGDWRGWVARLVPALSRVRAGECFVIGGEPTLKLPARRGAGGRMTHLAAALGSELLPLLREGRLELLCASSDGLDGESGAAGAFLGRAQAQAAPEASRWRSAVRGFRSAELLSELGALIPSLDTGTNVQDLIIARIPR